MDQRIRNVLPLRFRWEYEEKDKKMFLREIRLRVGQPLEWVGETSVFSRQNNVQQQDVQDMLEYATDSSLYAFQEEIKQGFLTMRGGHRIGVAGRVVMGENDIVSFRNITFLNLRVARQRKGQVQMVRKYLGKKDEKSIVLIASPPGYGKTTFLRELIRVYSEEGMHVVLVDERSEVAGSYQGIPQLDIGTRTDVLDGCSKSVGLMLALRGMGPDYLAVDEVGEKEWNLVYQVMTAGCGMIMTIHASSMKDLRNKRGLRELLSQGYITNVVEMQEIGQVGKVWMKKEGEKGEVDWDFVDLSREHCHWSYEE